MSWTIIARDARFSPALGRMVRIETQKNHEGKTREFAFVVSQDGTRRPVHLTGMEQALEVACAQAKVNLVPVVVPHIDPSLEDDPEAQHDDALSKIHAIMDGTTNTYELGNKGAKLYPKIGRQEALRRYGYQTVDVCERIPSGNAAGS